MNTIKIQNTDLVRDMGTNAILNTDADGLRRYKAMRSKLLSEKREAQDTKVRLEMVERDMKQLRELVSELTVLRSRG